MSIRKWHKGKLIILWAWGGAIGALSFTAFMSDKVESSPIVHLAEILFSLLVFLVLSAITWQWLGDRKGEGPDAGEPKVSLEVRADNNKS